MIVLSICYLANSIIQQILRGGLKNTVLRCCLTLLMTSQIVIFYIYEKFLDSFNSLFHIIE